MRLHRLPSELGHLSAAEFFEAQAYLAEEPLDPALLAALAEMLAAVANGPLQRQDKRLWSAADFLPRRWQPAEPPPPPPDLRAFVAGVKGKTAAAPQRRRK
jgi:hypothetical protein